MSKTIGDVEQLRHSANMRRAVKWPVAFLFIAGAWVFVYQLACIFLWGADKYEGYTWVLLNTPIALALASVFALLHLVFTSHICRKVNKRPQAMIYVIAVDMLLGLSGFVYFGLAQHSWVYWALPFLIACLISVAVTIPTTVARVV